MTFQILERTDSGMKDTGFSTENEKTLKLLARSLGKPSEIYSLFVVINSEREQPHPTIRPLINWR